MKKILSVMLAIMMLFGALSISASAANLTVDEYSEKFLNNDNVIIRFDFGSGTSMDEQPVYDPDTSGWVYEYVTGIYYRLPGAEDKELVAGDAIMLPDVVPPEGQAFKGWSCSVVNYDLTVTKPFEITDEIVLLAHGDTPKGVIKMTAIYGRAAAEEDTMATVLGILTKVFGTIIGILFLDGSSSAGIALIEKLLGGLM